MANIDLRLVIAFCNSFTSALMVSTLVERLAMSVSWLELVAELVAMLAELPLSWVWRGPSQSARVSVTPVRLEIIVSYVVFLPWRAATCS